jgi:hypothetical protein
MPSCPLETGVGLPPCHDPVSIFFSSCFGLALLVWLLDDLGERHELDMGRPVPLPSPWVQLHVFTTASVPNSPTELSLLPRAARCQVGPTSDFPFSNSSSGLLWKSPNPPNAPPDSQSLLVLIAPHHRSRNKPRRVLRRLLAAHFSVYSSAQILAENSGIFRLISIAQSTPSLARRTARSQL